MNLVKGETTSVYLPVGFKLDISGNGSVVRNDRADTGQSFDGWPITLGPYNVPADFTIVALLSDVTYSVSVVEATTVRLTRIAAGDLPTYGETGVIYQTEVGLKWWDEMTGNYLATDGAPAVPELAEGGEPEITGTLDIGDTLTCSTGTWLNRPTSYAYQWYIDGAPDTEIEGETGSTYVLQAGDVDEDILCTVIASNDAGPADTAAAATAVGPVTDPEA